MNSVVIASAELKYFANDRTVSTAVNFQPWAKADDGSCILNLHSGERMEMQHRDGVYVLETKIAPSNRQVCPFGGQGR